MKKTTQCYLEKNGYYLMLYRDKKPNDINEGKWIAVGGKVEDGETPAEANIREVFEETGITLRAATFHGIARFSNTQYESEDMYLFSSSDFDLGEEIENKKEDENKRDRKNNLPVPLCNEGSLSWVKKEDMLKLPMWEGDKEFLESILNGEKNIELELIYDGKKLVRVKNGL